MADQTENTGAKQPKKGQFPTNTSGNPKGRPKGARNQATLAAEMLLDGDAKTITAKCISLAKAGDMTAIRLCLERILPPRKTRPLLVTIPTISKPGDILAAVNAVLVALSKGQVTPDEADALLGTVEAARRAIETEELYRELDDLQSRLEALHG